MAKIRYIYQDNNISLKAKGMFTYLSILEKDNELSDVSIEKLSSKMLEGTSSIANTIKELKNHGYLSVEHQKENGRFVGVIYILNECPQGE